MTTNTHLAISCLGFAVYTESKNGWPQIKQLETAIEFTEGLINSLRPHLAYQTFIQSLRRREKLQEDVLIFKQVHGSFDWISKKLHPDYWW